MKRVILLTVWTAAVACVASFATIAVSPLLVDVQPFNQLLFFNAIRVRGAGAAPARTASEKYHYTTYMGKLPVRIDNETGNADLLYADGWHAASPGQRLSP